MSNFRSKRGRAPDSEKRMSAAATLPSSSLVAMADKNKRAYDTMRGKGADGADVKQEEIRASFATRLFGVVVSSPGATAATDESIGILTADDTKLQIPDDVMVLGLVPFLDLQAVGRLGRTSKVGKEMLTELDGIWQVLLETKWGRRNAPRPRQATGSTASSSNQPNSSYRDLCRRMSPLGGCTPDLAKLYKMIQGSAPCKAPKPLKEEDEKKLAEPKSATEMLSKFKIYIDIWEKSSKAKVLRTTVTPTSSMLRCGIRGASELYSSRYHYKEEGGDGTYPGRINVKEGEAEPFHGPPPKAAPDDDDSMDESWASIFAALRRDKTNHFALAPRISFSSTDTDALVTPLTCTVFPPSQKSVSFATRKARVAHSDDSMISSIGIDVPVLALPSSVWKVIQKENESRRDEEIERIYDEYMHDSDEADSDEADERLDDVHSREQFIYVEGQIMLHLCAERIESTNEWKVESYGFTADLYETNREFDESFPWTFPPLHFPNDAEWETEEEKQQREMSLRDEFLFCILSEICALPGRTTGDYKSS